MSRLLVRKLFAPLLVLLRFERSVDIRLLLLLGVMDGASGIGAHLVDFTLAVALRDDGLSGELAGLELRPLRLFLVLRLLRRDGNVWRRC
jgi:hypothetical protein